MVTQTASSAQLCDQCHQKPKFGNHQYCSRTCAAQATAFCNQCHKKPRFQAYDYCSKHCASIATAGNSAKANNPVANGSTSRKGGSGNKPAATSMDPVQIAQLVAQYAPQLQSLIATVQSQGPSSISKPVHLQQVGNQSSMNGGAMQAEQGTTGIHSIFSLLQGKKKAKSTLNVSTKQPSDDTRCSIPGCKQLVYVDEGVVSEFCSLRHREEAVSSGLRPPCIMCLMLPQSNDDYFCSKACLEESMNKQIDEDDEEEHMNSQD